ncbi:MAG: DUF5131 family protein [Devosia sp.]
MSGSTKIEWTDSTWNPWWGCQTVGPGCDHCYAEAHDKRTGGAHFGVKHDRRRTSETNWNEIDRWQLHAGDFMAAHGRRRRVFVGSMMDIFDNAVPLEWTLAALGRLERCDQLDVQLLTKRVGNVPDRIPHRWTTGLWPRHIGLMTTIVNQQEHDRDVPKLDAIKWAFGLPWTGLSMEPLLGQVDLAAISVDWVIVGGESGHHARPMHPDWVRALRDQCADAAVPFLFKQWGEWTPGMNVQRHTGHVQTAHWFDDSWAFGRENLARVDGHIDDEPDLYRVGKREATRWLDGTEHNGFPRTAI